MVCALQGLLNVLAAPNTTDEGKMFVEGLQVSENQYDNNKRLSKTPIENTIKTHQHDNKDFQKHQYNNKRLSKTPFPSQRKLIPSIK